MVKSRENINRWRRRLARSRQRHREQCPGRTVSDRPASSPHQSLARYRRVKLPRMRCGSTAPSEELSDCEFARHVPGPRPPHPQAQNVSDNAQWSALAW